MTAEKFYLWANRPENERARWELAEGQVIEMPSPGEAHALVCWFVAQILTDYLRAHGRGHLLTNDCGLIVARNPDTVRGTDIMLSLDNLTLEEAKPGHTDRTQRQRRAAGVLVPSRRPVRPADQEARSSPSERNPRMNSFKSAVLLLAIALVGCGKAEPTKSEVSSSGKIDASTPPIAGPTIAASTTGIAPLAPTPPAPAFLEPNDPTQQLAERFIADLRIASDKAEPLPAELLNRVSPAFLKIIGKPLLSDADKKHGYSEGAASIWLRHVGTQLVGIAPPNGYGSPSVAVLIGSWGNGAGRFLIRMVFAEGWKVDWFSLGTIKAPAQKPTSTEGSYQDFAVLAFLDALTGNPTSRDDRIALLGGVTSTKLKNAWAEPFEGDKARGYDFNATKLGLKLDELGTGVTAFARVSGSSDSYVIEMAKGESKAVYALKLVKGATPGEWLVDEFTKQ